MQTAKGSLVETLVGTAVGFCISVATWEFVVKPIWHLETSFVSNLTITLLFTVISIARGYVLRRFFNMLTHKNKKMSHESTDSDNGTCP